MLNDWAAKNNSGLTGHKLVTQSTGLMRTMLAVELCLEHLVLLDSENLVKKPG